MRKKYWVNKISILAAACISTAVLAGCENGKKTAEVMTEFSSGSVTEKEGIQQTKELLTAEEIPKTPEARSVYMLENSQPDSKGNRLVSEYGLSLALRMLAEAAEGETKEVIQSWTGREEDYSDLSNGAAETANMFLLRDDHAAVKMKKSYEKTLKEKYAAKDIIFKKEQAEWAAVQANEFIEHNTNGMIKDFFDADTLGGDDYLSSLVNILHFKAGWKDEMKEIPEYSFRTAEGREIKVNGLKDTGSRYFENDTMKGFVKPYGRENENDHSYSFYGILPNDDSGKIDLSKLDLENNTERSGEVELTVTMPEFEFETDSILNDMLRNAGMERLFDGGCDLSGGFECKNGYVVKVSEVRQKAKVKLDKKGTEAAAVTAIKMETMAYMPAEKEEIQLDFNRPFVFMIYDNTINRPLFMGVVENPEK